jgi:presenilin 1
VGTIAIFYQKGIPQYINQTYLVLTSVIVAWQLSYFTNWMAWALLVMLALYDLFAVLSPCGPLKALVKLMTKEDAPAMPGLLYEARLPDNATRPGRDGGGGNSTRSSSSSRRVDGSSTAAAAAVDATSSPTSVTDNMAGCSRERSVSNNLEMISSQQQQEVTTTTVKSNPSSRQEEVTVSQRVMPSSADNSMSAVEAGTRTSMSNSTHSRTASLPLAIAKVYKLPLVLRRSEAIHTTITTIDTSSPTSYLQQEFTSQELQENVIVKFPRGGGRIESTLNDDDGEVRYVVYNRDGEIRRTLVVDENGKVMEVVKSSNSKSVGENNIKLGLGDFIFYSVLVSKAAENSFAAFVACFISILMGLGGTLVLLAVYHKALPALPISIFLAVVFFVLTIYCMSPWIEVMWQVPYYC